MPPNLRKRIKRYFNLMQELYQAEYLDKILDNTFVDSHIQFDLIRLLYHVSTCPDDVNLKLYGLDRPRNAAISGYWIDAIDELIQHGALK